MQTATGERYRRRLIRLSERVQADANSARSSSSGSDSQNSELSSAPLHLADRGTQEFDQKMDSILVENEVELSRAIQAALERIDNDEYGVCQRCGGQIQENRLEALPYATTCVTCAQEEHSQEDYKLAAGRPATPRDLDADASVASNDETPGRMAPAETAFEERPLADRHAAGEAGGGAESGGLAGSNWGRGEPDIERLQEEGGSGTPQRNSVKVREGEPPFRTF